jgi:hypothetical protein
MCRRSWKLTTRTLVVVRTVLASGACRGTLSGPLPVHAFSLPRAGFGSRVQCVMRCSRMLTCVHQMRGSGPQWPNALGVPARTGLKRAFSGLAMFGSRRLSVCPVSVEFSGTEPTWLLVRPLVHRTTAPMIIRPIGGNVSITRRAATHVDARGAPDDAVKQQRMHRSRVYHLRCRGSRPLM